MLDKLRAMWRKAGDALLGRKNLNFGAVLDGLPISRMNDFRSYLKAGTGKVWASWHACDLVAQQVMETPFKVAVKGDSEKEIKVPSDLQHILSSPNGFETWGEFVYKVVMLFKQTGNVFIFKSEQMADMTRPRELFILPTAQVKIIPSRADKVKGYIFTVNGEDMPLEIDEVIHIKRPHPNNEYWGLGDIEAGAHLFDEHINRGAFEDHFWKNGARPTTLLTTADEPESEDKWEKLKAKWNRDYGGTKNAGKTAFLTGNWEKIEMGVSPAEMQSLESGKLNVEQIYTIHGVPLSVAGIRDAANFATARIDDIRFRRYTIRPICRFVGETLSTDLIQDWNPQWEFLFNLSGLSNVTEAIADATPAFDRGWISINEARQMMELDTIDEPLFDQHFINAAMVPLDLSGIPDFGRTEGQAAQLMAQFTQRTFDAQKPNSGNGSENHRAER